MKQKKEKQMVQEIISEFAETWEALANYDKGKYPNRNEEEKNTESVIEKFKDVS